MPKKPPRNAFYFFMQDFKEEQRKKGINYQNLNEVAIAAGPLWKEAHPAVRSKFEERAKKEKQKNNIPEMKYTSNGISFAEIERQERELKEAEEIERQDVRNIVKLKSFNKDCSKEGYRATFHAASTQVRACPVSSVRATTCMGRLFHSVVEKSTDIAQHITKQLQSDIFHEDFYLMDVNYFCKTNTDYYMAESTVLRFNLRDGIRDQYHEIINPGPIPVGFAYEVKVGSEEIGLAMPDESLPRTNYIQVLAHIIDFLKQKDRNMKTMPPLFTMPNKVAPVQDFIFQMCNRAAEDESIFRVYKLDFLFFTLINAIKTQANEGFPRESLALEQLKKDLFKYTPGLGCQIHEETDKSIECTTARTKGWAYTVLDSCCPVCGLDMRPASHLPPGTDLDTILTIKEQKKGRVGPSVATASGSYVSGNTSLVSESGDDSVCNSESTMKKNRPAYKPLRMPKEIHSNPNRLPPELTEDNFPGLGPATGAGRGRGLSGSFNKMNLKK